MMELVVVAFKGDRERAAAVLHKLRGDAEPWTARLHGASVVYRDHEGKLAIDESFEATKGDHAIAGGFTGSLVGLLLAVMTLPVIGASSTLVVGGVLVAGALGGEVIGSHHFAAHADAEATWWRDEVGISTALSEQVQSTIAASDSAIVCLQRGTDPELAARFAPFGGDVRTIPLTAEQAAKVSARLRV